jgi:hypothetical protein
MKKVLLAFAVASVFAACDDSKTDSTTTTDSTNVKVDSSAITPAVPDTTITVDTSANKMSADTTKKK